MSRIKAGILDSTTSRIHGYAIGNSVDSGGMYFAIDFHNNATSRASVEYRLHNLDALPEGYSAKILNPTAHKYELCNDSVLSEIDLSPGGSHGDRRYVVIGTEEYFNTVLRLFSPLTFSFIKAYPNPFNGIVRLHYTLPPDIGEVRMALYNVLGKKLWNKVQRKDIGPGEHTVIFNSRNDMGLRSGLPAGVYILRLTAKDISGKLIYSGDMKITCLK
jgi:hypothetical protein